MKRGRYFFIAFIAAAITFGCLTAFVNPKYSGMRYGYGYQGGWHHGWYNRGYYPPYPYYAPPAYQQPDSMHGQPQQWHQ